MGFLHWGRLHSEPQSGNPMGATGDIRDAHTSVLQSLLGIRVWRFVEVPGAYWPWRRDMERGVCITDVNLGHSSVAG